LSFEWGRSKHCQRLVGEACHGRRTYDEVRNEDLEDLCAKAGAAGEDLLQEADQHVAHGSTDESAVGGHLGDARADIVAVLASVVGEPRGKDFLKSGEGAGGEHLGSERIGLELLEVCLGTVLDINVPREVLNFLQRDSPSATDLQSRLRRSCVR
jgi:hypothetical protein